MNGVFDVVNIGQIGSLYMNLEVVSSFFEIVVIEEFGDIFFYSFEKLVFFMRFGCCLNLQIYCLLKGEKYLILE